MTVTRFCLLRFRIVYFLGVFMRLSRQTSLSQLQEERFLHPTKDLEATLRTIYKQGNFSIGWPKGQKRIFAHLARPNTVAIVGAAFGDEGKGRLVDNYIETLLKKPKIKNVHVVRFQGGNNAGHTIEKGKIKLALHVVPSAVLYEQALGIMDRGMIIHPEDLQTEVTYVEEKAGSLKNRLFLSDDALLCTDIERAEELLNRIKDDKAKGGTGRGISAVYAHYYEKTGLKIANLLADDWHERLDRYYTRKTKEFAAFDTSLTEMEVPDFAATVRRGKAQLRTVGKKKEFLERIDDARDWLINRKLVTNTYHLHTKTAHDPKNAFLFEGAQGAGLDAWLGTLPDVTASNTSVYAVREGTAYWKAEMIANRIGIFKATYASSVGARRMPTHIGLPSPLNPLPRGRGQVFDSEVAQTRGGEGGKTLSPDQQWAAYVRETAHEYGTTTGRPRDILFLDLPLLTYNARMAGIEVLAATHLDIALKDMGIKICTHYTDQKGKAFPYQPGLRYLKDAIPQYVELPSWDGAECNRARSIQELPDHAVKFLAFLQDRTGYPIVAVTTGPDRKNLLTLPGYSI